MRLTIAWTLGAVLSGCATQINGRYQPINVSTTEVPSECVVDGMTFAAPAIITLRRKAKHTVKCTSGDGKVATVTLRAGMSSAWAGNIFYGLVPGLIFDYATGAINELPDRVVMSYTEKSGMLVHPTPVEDWKKEGLRAP